MKAWPIILPAGTVGGGAYARTAPVAAGARHSLTPSQTR